MTKKVIIKTNIESQLNTETIVAAALARRISALRGASNLTFDALAARAGVSKGALVQIEQGNSNPSISTLCRLAVALGVSVADLVAPPDEVNSAVWLVEKNEARILWRGPNGGFAVLLAGTLGPDMLELWRWEMKPDEVWESSSHSRGTREIIHVTRGKLVLLVDDNKSIVAAGTSAIALTDRPHTYANQSNATVEFYMTVHEPVKVP